jgi:hypothetical protein
LHNFKPTSFRLFTNTTSDADTTHCLVFLDCSSCATTVTPRPSKLEPERNQLPEAKQEMQDLLTASECTEITRFGAKCTRYCSGTRTDGIYMPSPATATYGSQRPTSSSTSLWCDSHGVVDASAPASSPITTPSSARTAAAATTHNSPADQRYTGGQRFI